MSAIPLLIFAKEPRAGKVKTRLQTDCRPEQAAAIAGILLQASIENALAHWAGEVVLAVWPPVQHPICQRLAAHYKIDLVTQQDGDLGSKMHQAFEQAGYPAAIIGSDVPHIPAQVFKTAHQRLKSGDNCIGPSEDGGYYLIGLGQPAPFLFAGIDWGESVVMQQTQAQANANQFSVIELNPLNDVDNWDDVLALADQLPVLREYLQAQGL